MNAVRSKSGALWVGPRRSGAQRSLCRGSALSVWGPGAAPRRSLSLSGPSGPLLTLFVLVRGILIRILILMMMVASTRISTPRLSLLPMLILKRIMKLWQGSNPQSFFSLITTAVLGILVFLSIVYTNAYVRLISSFITNTTMDFYVITGTTTVTSTADATIPKLATSTTITLLLVFMLGSVLATFNRIVNTDGDTNIMVITTHSSYSVSPYFIRVL